MIFLILSRRKRARRRERGGRVIKREKEVNSM